MLPLARSFPFRRLLLLWLLCSTACGITAQGQPAAFRRFQYHHHRWNAFHTAAFHLYFPEGYDSLGAAAARDLPGALKLVARRMNAGLQQPPNVILYPSPGELYESNAGSEGPGNLTFPTFLTRGNRLLLAYTGSYEDLRAQLYEGLARAAWESTFSTGVEAQSSQAGREAIPYWLSEGTIRYFAHGWPLAAEDRMLRIIAEAHTTDPAELMARYPALCGQAFCYYLSRQFLPQTPSLLLQQLRKRKPLPRALRLVTQTPADSLYAGFMDFYRRRAAQVRTLQDTGNNGTTITTLPRRKGMMLQALNDATGSRTAIVTAAGHIRYVDLYDASTRQRHRVVTYLLPPWIGDHGADPYPLVAWDGGSLLVARPVKGIITLSRYGADGEWQATYPLEGVDGVGSLQLVKGSEWLLGAWRRAQSDIVTYDVQRNRYRALTGDAGDDHHPAFSGSDLLFVSERKLPRSRKSERLADTLIATHGLFRLAADSVVPWLTDTVDFIRYEQPIPLADGKVLLTTTRQGTAQYALAGNVHRPTTAIQLLAASGPVQYLPEQETIITRRATSDSLFLHSWPLNEWLQAHVNTEPAEAPWLQDYRADAAARAREDSILQAAAAGDQPAFLSAVLSGGKGAGQAARRADSLREALRFGGRKVTPYVLQLYSAYFTAKVNNDYFINRYQPYQSYQGTFKFPETGGMAQGGFSDLFENHHFTIAYRLPAGSEGSDFVVRYRNTARMLDWGLAYFRKSEDLKPDPLRQWVDESGRPYPNLARVKTNYYEVSAQYPLSYYSGIGFVTALRHDKTIFPATERYSLDFPAYRSLWSVSTLSYDISKLRPTLPLLQRGFSAQAAADVFKGFTQKEEALAGATASVSYHQPLYRYITLVLRAQAGASAGDAKVLYNLGGVDNNITPRVDSSVHFAQDAPYAFQTLVTPFRGYYQNSLYGSRYCLVNADVYFPLFQSLVPVETPLPSLNDLQLGLFVDAAAAGGARTYSMAGKGWLAAFGASARTTLAGYPLRFDIAWPGTFRAPPVWYLSLSLK